MLSNTTSIRFVDYSTDTPQRTVYKIPDDYYDSDMTLINFGVYAPTATATTCALYPTLSGIASSIRNIYLKVNGTIVDYIPYFEQWATLKTVSCSNNRSLDYKRFTMLNGMGFMESSVEGDAGVAPASGGLTLRSDWVDFYRECNGAAVVNNQINIPSVSSAQSGMLKLREFMGFLQAAIKDGLPYLPNVTLEIEWDTDPDTYFNDTTNPVANFAPVHIRPTLVMTVLVGKQAPDRLVIPYLSVVAEPLAIPAVATPANDSVPRVVNIKSQGFQGMTVKNLTMVNLTTVPMTNAAARWLTVGTRSPAQVAEVIGLTLNNVAITPDQGIYSPALKYHFLNETKGPLNMPLAAALPSLTDNTAVLDAATFPLTGQYSVTSYPINRVVDNLIVRHERLYSAADGQNQAFTLLLMGEVYSTFELQRTAAGPVIRVSK